MGKAKIVIHKLVRARKMCLIFGRGKITYGFERGKGNNLFIGFIYIRTARPVSKNKLNHLIILC
jgi:hypothetical protein